MPPSRRRGRSSPGARVLLQKNLTPDVKHGNLMPHRADKAVDCELGAKSGTEVGSAIPTIVEDHQPSVSQQFPAQRRIDCDVESCVRAIDVNNVKEFSGLYQPWKMMSR